MRTPQEKYKRPELFLQELLSKYAKGQILDSTTNNQPFMRAVVLAVDVVGGRLSNPDGEGTIDVGKEKYKAVIGPPNPQNSIKARIITRGFDRFFTDDDVGVYWPMTQNDHMSIPVKPGEHVYVMFEDEHFEHGLWLFKVAGHDDANFFEGIKAYKSSVEKNAMGYFEQQEQEQISEEDITDSVSRKNLNETF